MSPDPSFLELRGRLGDWQSLQTRTVAVFGLGAVGGAAFVQLARCGIGRLLGVDPDHYGAESWQTQPVTPADAGRGKAEVIAAQARAVNPGIRVETVCGFAQEMPLRWLRGADVFALAGDNREVAVWAGVLAVALGKPLVQGAVHGETWTALVRSYDLRDPDAACPACAFSDREWSQLSERYGCDPAARPAVGAEATRTLPTLCATAAQLLVGECLKFLLGQEKTALRGEEAAYCLLTHRLWRSRHSRNGRCRCPHRSWRLVDLDESAGRLTPAALITSTEPLPLVRGEIAWCSFTTCAGCGERVPVRRFARPGTGVGNCRCGRGLKAGPLGLCSTLPGADLAACSDMPLSLLGLPDGAALGVSADGEDWTYFLPATEGNRGQ
jgi:molybdopterin/thiamine biosynthesis adenylyltransferase